MTRTIITAALLAASTAPALAQFNLGDSYPEELLPFYGHIRPLANYAAHPRSVPEPAWVYLHHPTDRTFEAAVRATNHDADVENVVLMMRCAETYAGPEVWFEIIVTMPEGERPERRSYDFFTDGSGTRVAYDVGDGIVRADQLPEPPVGFGDGFNDAPYRAAVADLLGGLLSIPRDIEVRWMRGSERYHSAPLYEAATFPSEGLEEVMTVALRYCPRPNRAMVDAEIRVTED